MSHLTDSGALNFVAEKQAFYDKMSKKVINNGGCMMWGITLLLAYLTWKNLSTNFVLAIFFGLALYGYIRLFVYVPYWKKQSK